MYGYLDRGRYLAQVERYLDLFPRENVKILIFEEDVANEQDETARSLFRFLGVDDRVPLKTPVSAGRPPLPSVELFQPAGARIARRSRRSHGRRNRRGSRIAAGVGLQEVAPPGPRSRAADSWSMLRAPIQNMAIFSS